MSIILEIMGGLGIVCVGAIVMFAGGLGNSVKHWFGGMLVIIAGAVLTGNSIYNALF